MNTRPPTQPGASFADALTRATVAAEGWRNQYTTEHDRAEHLHEALRRVLGLATQAVAGRAPTDAVLAQIQDVAKAAIL